MINSHAYYTAIASAYESSCGISSFNELSNSVMHSPNSFLPFKLRILLGSRSILLRPNSHNNFD